MSEPMPEQRRRDGIRQAERQEVRLGIGAQHAERQHHQACEARRARAAVSSPSTDSNGAQFLGHRVGRRWPFRRLFGQRVTGSRGPLLPLQGSRSAPGAVREGVACRISTMLRPANAGRPASNSKQ